MVVKAKPKVYIAGDGAEFATEAEAARHDELVEATRAYEQAKERLGRAMANTARTADGELFDIRPWADYWFVNKWSGFGPSLRRVSFGYGTGVTLGGHKDKEVRLQVTEGDREKRTVEFGIRELYSSETAAKAALADAIRERIAEHEEELRNLA